MYPARRSTDRPRSYTHRPRAELLRAIPIMRWVARTEAGETYFLWQHERLGWWAWSDALAKPGALVRWRPIVAPLMLAISEGESLTLTFTDWPTTELERHDWWHEVGKIARLGCNVRRGWPGDPPVAALAAGEAA